MTSPIEDQFRELRIAPVMTGGTSLAVWMGGATLELYRLTRAFAESDVDSDGLAIYRRLMELTRTRAVVDVVTGTSAGGLNGTLLATAQAFEVPIDAFTAIRDTWQGTADITKLLRSRKEVDPPSLLKGDAYFEQEIDRALTAFRARAPEDPQGDVDLVTTLTTIKPVKKTRFDILGEAIVEADHAHRLRFTGEQICSTDETILTKLAIAARTSAGIPGVFEPSFIPIGEADATKSHRPNFGPHASFNFSRWAVDGGVVVNLPLTEALDRVYERTAAGEVRRVILYVNPTPAVETPDEADPASPMPGLRQSVATIVTAPRAEGISDDLDQIDRHNRQIDRQSQTRVALGALGSTVKLSAPGYIEYRHRRASTSIEHLLAQAFDDNPTLAGRPLLAEKLVDSRERLFPEASDRIDRPAIGGFPERRWGWGIESLDHAISTELGLISRALTLTDADTEPQRVALLEAKSGLHLYRARLTAVRAVDEHFWARRFDALAADPNADATGDPDHWHGAWPYEDATDAAFGDVMFERAKATNAQQAAHLAAYGPGPIATVEVPVADGLPTADDLAMQYPGSVAPEAAPNDPESDWGPNPMEGARNAVFELLRGAHFETARLSMEAAPAIAAVSTHAIALAAAVAGTVDSPERLAATALSDRATALRDEAESVVPAGSEKAAVAARALRLHQVQVLLLGDVIQREQRVSLVQLSSNMAAVPTALTGRTSAEKLAGPELARLGAFLKPSWRANDWFWGRLDAAHRLVLLLLQPQELKRQGTIAEFVTWVQSLPRLDPYPEVDVELARLAGTTPPDEMPHTAAFIAEHVQVAIARTEIPLIADAVDRTVEQGGNEVDRGAFRRAARAAFPLPPLTRPSADAEGQPSEALVAPGPAALPTDAMVRDVVAKLRIGSETLSTELGYGLLSRVASRAVAVSVNILSAPSANIPLAGRLLRPFRAPVKAVSSLFELVTALDPTRRAIAAFLAAIAGAVLALRLIGGDVPAALVAASAAVFVVLLVTAVLRSRLFCSALVIAVTGAAVTLTLLGSDLRPLLYNEVAPTQTTTATADSTITVDAGGVLRLTTGDGSKQRITDQPLVAGDVVTFRSTGGILAGADKGPQTQGWKELLFLGRPRQADPPTLLRPTFGGDRGPLSAFNGLILVVAIAALAGASRGRKALIALAGLVTIALSPLAWSSALTGVEPTDGGGVKGWLVSTASSLHDFGLLILLVIFVGAGVVLTFGYDTLRSRLTSSA